MSIQTNLTKISYDTRKNVSKDLEVSIENKSGVNNTIRYIYPFKIENNDIILPFAYASTIMKLKRPKRTKYPTSNMEFKLTLRPEQKKVKKEAIKQLNKTGSILMSMYCGFGKTACGINLACTIGLKTLIIVNKLVLMKQWEESINKFCSSVIVKRLSTKSKKNDECDFYIMNAQNVEKMGKIFFSNIGCVIVDECHLIMAETLSRSLQYITPRYLIGLSATPYRPDGLNILLDLYFGTYKIVRKLWREHKVYKITTGFKPKIEYSVNGKVNWGVILDSQANNVNRNGLILKLLQHFSKRNFLVLVKRISQGKYLQEKLVELGEDVTSLLGSNQDFKKESRILIGTNSKIGVGFDHSKLDALLLAADVEEYFVQYLGRVFRTEKVEPIILDLVDNYSILNKHWNSRKGVYKEHGGIIQNFSF